VGQRWDINGNNNNVNAIGLYVPDTGNPASLLSKITSLFAESAFRVGDGSKNTEAEFNRTKIKHGSYTHTETQNFIEGSYTLSSLNTAIRNLIGESTIGYRVPANGTISQNIIGSVSMWNRISSLEYMSAGYYRIHAISEADGQDMAIDCNGASAAKANFVIY